MKPGNRSARSRRGSARRSRSSPIAPIMVARSRLRMSEFLSGLPQRSLSSIGETAMIGYAEKAALFRAMHAAPRAFVIANPWDAGSARILAGLGFKALATSSGASAGVLGRRDGQVSRDEALAQARAIVEATDLPVSGDLEKGFGDAPEAAAETIRRAAEVGLVGGSIEDATGDSAKPLYDIDHATERVA